MQAADGLIADGSIRSGKTVSLSLSFVLWGMARFNGQNFALCGKTIASLRRNLLTELLQRCGNPARPEKNPLLWSRAAKGWQKSFAAAGENV